ncbi:MAG: hypothetical protein A3F84_18730 [Candidatus Handelsmanbacteria bacterium RIFCSPLOWO2_12_FULL_64_10]|uniref:4Fe-4S ferredoxin-type domain-containing protein n=1 Tax=Handelsmanbacteria sp. (strain RIFCSPLOWO2_12_FULL_64_10) TaxID=1817868 RepID=A0A1F6D2B0_HANXR|nr:MAG: hypothetical protein A3F84_18730 [Candidatus Handelsmanbacteria bacterium RIFCSPLOWO2_12_FULL_64_10]
MKRRIIEIDEALCDGCGNCIPSCPEQAIQVVDTPEGKKARLVKELYCDGLGACLGACPAGALTVEERESAPYDEEATVARIKEVAPEMLETHLRHIQGHAQGSTGGRAQAELRQWPVQLHLIPPHAPFLKGADLAVVADCVPFACANFHLDFLKGRAIAVGCPKLDDVDAYIDKLAQIIETADLKRIQVIYMEVPCCYGLVYIARKAMAAAGKDVPFETAVIGVKGERQET